MTNVLILSSSFLLPKNSSWDVFKKNNLNLTFTEYADYSMLEKKNDSNYIFIIIFIEDIIENSNDQIVIKNILKTIDSCCKLNNQPIIICPIYSDYNDPLSNLSSNNYNLLIYRKFYNQLEKINRNYENFNILDISLTFSKYGLEKCIDKRNWYEFKMRLSFLGLKLLSKKILDCINLFKVPSKKVLVLDCDNTLWGGVIAEDGMRNIKIGTDGIGKIFIDFQIEILKIKSQGVLLCIVSKNDQTEVENVFVNHSAMLLKKNDFVELRINWENKSENINNIARSLNLGLDSFVFWDDNPIEREEVKSNLPKVEVLEIPENLEQWPSFLANLKFFFQKNASTDDKNKTELYHQRKKFENNLLKSDDFNSFLKNIKAKPSLVDINDSNINRASQMTLKTNQFNFRTKRYTVSEFEDFIKKESHKSFLLEFSDKFGNHGNVGLMMLKNLNSQNIIIENFLISCRILGRHLEIWFLVEVCKYLNKISKKKLIIEYIPSDKNSLIQKYFENNYFKDLYDNKSLTKRNNSYSIKIETFCKKIFNLY